jgi:vacuolar-type H+-ATPase subunit E/Vma4
MPLPDPQSLETVLNSIHDQASREAVRISQHAQEEMTEEGIVLDEALDALRSGQISKTTRSTAEERVVSSAAILGAGGPCIWFARRLVRSLF